jgi:alpha-L-arabinofuranosidase
MSRIQPTNPTATLSTKTIVIDTQSRGKRLDPMFYGIFFEEINHAGDGGLYAELARNRSFEDHRAPEGMAIRGGKAVSPTGWEAKFDCTPIPGWELSEKRASGSMALDTANPLNAASPTALRLEASAVSSRGRVGAMNTGYWGIPFTKGAKYALSLYARAEEPAACPLTVSFETPKGTVLAEKILPRLSASWKRYAAILESNGDCTDGRLVLSLTRIGAVCLDIVSLFPKKTWKNRPNGLRPDLAEMLVGLRPAFMRFPGGCIVEGATMENAFRWKNTIGDIAQRPGRWNLWYYRSPEGLGYHEFLQLCEDMKTEPLLVLNCGMACQARLGKHAPMSELNEWIQDALDAIEYANGPLTSPWGKRRAENGHPKAFGLKYVEIGNENGGPDYEERYALFYHAIKNRYPKINLIANCRVDSAPMEIIDDHFYNTPEWFRANTRKYDKEERKEQIIYVGEYACNTNVGKGNLLAGLADAVFLMGLERNADLVRMASYAPLFYNINDRCWPVNLVGFDNHRCFGTPSYHAQKLFAEHRGDIVLPVFVESPRNIERKYVAQGGIAIETWGTRAEFKDIRVTADKKTLYKSAFKQGASEWKVTHGEWETTSGVFRTIGESDHHLAETGEGNWTDYTLTCKTRKMHGTQGITFHVRRKDEKDSYSIHIGLWNNTHSAVHQFFDGKATLLSHKNNASLEDGQWISVRIEVRNKSIACFMHDRELIRVEDIEVVNDIPLYEAVAHRVKKSGEIILKAVNFSEKRETVRVQLGQETKVSPRGTEFVLTSNKWEDENSVEKPNKVAPVSRPVEGLSNDFEYTLAPRSLTILRMSAKGSE